MRTLRLTLACIIGMNTVAPAMARDAAATAVDRARVAEELQCTRKTGKDVGNCLRDKLKSLEEGQRQFLKKQDERMDAWRLEHASMGLSPEYTRALRALQTELETERDAYNATLIELRRAIEEERQRVRDDTAARAVPVQASVKPSTKNTACFTGSRAKQRQCLRNSLYQRDATRGADKQGKSS